MSASSVYCHTCGAANPAENDVCFACQQPLAENADAAESGLLHGRYRILTQVGTGGFGAVYKAVDTHPTGRGNDIVAIKQINLHGLGSREVIEATDAFHREVLLLSDLVHPNLPRIHDHFTDPEHWYMVMDFLAGDTLEAYLRQMAARSARLATRGAPGAAFNKSGLLPLADILDIGLQLCTVLDYLHTRQPPIIFRDLKPANIMRTPGGRLYLIDFGIARHYKPGQAKDTMPFGSPGYAAPEQYGKAQTTPQSDIYSLGALLHHMLSGDDPTETPFGFAPLRLYGTAGLAELETLIMRMVELDASKRPASAQEVKEELQRVAALQASTEPRIWRPTQGQPPPPRRYWSERQIYPGARQQQQQYMNLPPRGLSRRKFITHSLLVGGVLILGMGSVANYLRLGRHDGAQVVYTGHADEYTVAWSPMGNQIASASVDKTVQVWNPANGSAIASYTGHTDVVHSLAWSSDGSYIASASNDQTVQVWEAPTGSPFLTYRGHTGAVNAVAWSPDGSLIASASNDGTVQVWNAATGAPFLTYRGHAGAVNAVAWSPSGEHIVSGGSDGTVQVYRSIDGAEVFVYTGHTGAVNAVVCSPDGQRVASAGEDKTVQVWSAVESYDNAFIYRGHAGPVRCVAWLPAWGAGMPDGQRIASGGDDTTVRVWYDARGDDVEQGNDVVYRGHAGRVDGVTWSPDGRRIASSSLDETVQVWLVE